MPRRQARRHGRRPPRLGNAPAPAPVPLRPGMHRLASCIAMCDLTKPCRRAVYTPPADDPVARRILGVE